MITEQEISTLISIVQSSKNPSKLFEIPYLTLHNRPHSFIRLGTRKVYVDFPRIVSESLIQEVLSLCEFLAQQIFGARNLKEYEEGKGKLGNVDDYMDRIRRFEHLVQIIRRQKEQPHELNSFYVLTQTLNCIGISWDIQFQAWYSRPIVRVYVGKYYKEVWPSKLLNFIHQLNLGNDSPVIIYNIARELSVSAPTLLQRNRNGYHQLQQPEIFSKFKEAGISSEIEIKKLKKLIQQLNKSIEVKTSTVFQLELKSIIDTLFADMISLAHSLENVLNTYTHYQLEYLALRKMLTDLGGVIFIVSLYQLSTEIPTRPISTNEKIMLLRARLDKYLHSFTEQWMQIYYDHEGLPFLAPVFSDDNDGIIRYSNYETLKNRCLKNSPKQIINESIMPSDTLLMESIDILRNYNLFVFDAIENGISVPSLKEDKMERPEEFKAYLEYVKLSDAVHEPLLTDFSPYSSTLEYIGFVHHLRKVNSIFAETLKAYRQAVKAKGK